jgi:hypothetical protein
MKWNPFSAERDEQLGRALREALDRGGQPEFVARVLGRLPMPRTSWDVLAGWGRPRIAAALLLAAALGWAVGWSRTRTDSATGTAYVESEVLGDPAPVGADELVSVVLREP